MTGIIRRALLAVALLGVTAAGLSACAVRYDDYHHRYWNDRDHHDHDRDHDRR